MVTKDAILKKLKSIKKDLTDLGINHVGLFGSYAKGDQNQTSDIDILIDFNPEKENFENFYAACELLELLFKNQKIEIVTIGGLSPYLGPKIKQEVLYA